MMHKERVKTNKELGNELRKNQMLNDPLPKVITRMAIPSIIAFLINSIYSLADTYFVSSLGKSATAAVTVNGSLDMFIMMAASFVAIGASSYISRLLGAREEEKASKVLSTAWVSAVLFGVIILIVGWIWMEPICMMLGATETCLQYSVDYATYILLVAPLMSANFVMNQSLRAEGAAMRSMIGMGFGGILNCILDPFFILQEVIIGSHVLPGLGLGVAGASMATAISKVVSFAILIFPYVTKRSTLRLSLRSFSIDSNTVRQVAAVGSSSAFRTLLNVIAGIILNNLAGDVSDACLAGIGVTTRVMMFPFGIILGFGTGFQPVMGYNWGAKRMDRVKGSLRFALTTSAIIGAVMGAVCCIYAVPIIDLFADTDPEMIAIGALATRIQAIALPIHAWVAATNWSCAALGYGPGAVLLAISRQGIMFLPIVWPLAHFFGANGLASVQGVADALSIVLAIPMLRHIKRMIREKEASLAVEAAGAETAQEAAPCP